MTSSNALMESAFGQINDVMAFQIAQTDPMKCNVVQYDRSCQLDKINFLIPFVVSIFTICVSYTLCAIDYLMNISNEVAIKWYNCSIFFIYIDIEFEIICEDKLMHALTLLTSISRSAKI